MYDVLGEIMVAPGDVDFLAGNRIAAVAIRNRSGAQGADIAARLRLGEVHRPGPAPFDQGGQVGLFLGLGAMCEQGLDGAETEHRAKAEGHIGAVEHLHHSEGERPGQPLAPPGFGCGKAHPAAFAEFLICLGESRRRDNACLGQLCAMRIPHRVQRGEHVAGKLSGFLKNWSNKFGIIGLKPGQSLELADMSDVTEAEDDVVQGGFISQRSILHPRCVEAVTLIG